MNSLQKIVLLIAAVFVLFSCTETETVKQKAGRPNIILILADDLAYSDIRSYGGEIYTPALDTLAANGLRYSQFYNAARCCPSRASLLTGLPPHLAGIGHMTQDHDLPGYEGSLASNSVTLAEVLKLAGYTTAMAGKWHVSTNVMPGGNKDSWPLQRGFDKFFGTLPGHGSQFDPKFLYDGNTPFKIGENFFYTDAISSRAAEWIQEFAGQPSPYFLYVAYTAPHYPIHARDETIKKYNGKYSEGWDSLRLKRFRALQKSGLLPPGTQLPRRDTQCYAWQNEKNKEWQQNRMQVYAAMIEEMDNGIASILKAVKESGNWENTVVIFLSDNGASSEGHLYNTIERRGDTWEDRMAPVTNRKGRPVVTGDFPGKPLGGDTTFGSYGPQWAHLSNTPFQRYKSFLHEGGIATPMIIQWPARISERGGIRHTVGDIRDFMPTFLEMAGASYPLNIRNQPTFKPEGKSLLPSMVNMNDTAARILCWEHEGNRAIRKGRWKLVSEYPGAWKTLRPYPNQGKWELYDMIIDRTETNNLAAAYPEIVKQLANEWENWARRSQVLDWKSIGGENWY